MNDEIFICTADLKKLFKKQKRIIFRVMIFCSILTFLFYLFQETRYRAAATFKQSNGKNDVSMNHILQGILQQGGDSDALPMMRSVFLVKEIVQKMGLQVEWQEKSRLAKLMARAKENLLYEFGFPLQDIDSFAFSKVIYEEENEQGLPFYLRFVSSDIFEFYNRNKECLGEGKIGETFQIENLTCTLSTTPKNLSFDQLYAFKANPWITVVEKYLSYSDIKPEKMDKNLLKMTCENRDRHLASNFLNQLMFTCQLVQKKDNERIADLQLSYLEKRKNELRDNLENHLDEQVAYMKKNLKENGFIGIEQEMEILNPPKEQYGAKLNEFDLDMKRFERLGISQLCNFEQKLLSLELEEKKTDLSSIVELHQVTQDLKEAKELLLKISNDEEVSSNYNILSDPKNLISILVDQINELRIAKKTEEMKFCASQVADYLNHYVNLLSQKEKTLHENLFQPTEYDEFKGLRLETAQKLFLEYQNQLDGLRLNIGQLRFIIDQVEDPQFDLSSLSSLSNDPITQEMVQKASLLTLQLQDEENRSLREQMRIKDSLATQKKFLFSHLGHIIEVQNLRAKLIERKILFLNKASQNLIKNEKELISGKLQDLRERMSNIPEKWRKESKLKLETNLCKSILEGMSQLAETKKVNSQLFQVEAKILDPAFPPLKPKASHLLSYSLIGGLISGFFLFGFLLFQGLARGLPVTLDNLRAQGLFTCGTLSSHCDASFSELNENDLETFRSISNFITDQNKSPTIITLLGGKYPDYSSNLSELLAIKNFKVILVHCIFDTILTSDHVPGWWDYFQNKENNLAIHKRENYDFLPTGGKTRHAAEILTSSKMSAFLDQLKKEYDIVLLYSRSNLNLAEAHAFMKISDLIILTASEETSSELKPFHLWEKQKNQENLTVVIYE